MKRLALLFPLLALAAAPARAEDPATNAPVIHARRNAMDALFGGSGQEVFVSVTNGVVDAGTRAPDGDEDLSYHFMAFYDALAAAPARAADPATDAPVLPAWFSVNYIAPLVFLLSIFVVAAFLLEGAVAFLCRNRKNAPRGPSRAFSVVAALAVATIVVQCFAICAERGRYRAAEEALRTAVSKNDVEARLGTPRRITRYFTETGRLVEWVYGFDSPLSPFPIGRPLVILFNEMDKDRIVHALWKRSGLPPRYVRTGPPPAPHAESADGAKEPAP